MLDQADKLAIRVAGANSALYDRDEFPEKPKRMRWATYWRLENRFYDLQDMWAVGLMRGSGCDLRRGPAAVGEMHGA